MIYKSLDEMTIKERNKVISHLRKYAKLREKFINEKNEEYKIYL